MSSACAPERSGLFLRFVTVLASMLALGLIWQVTALFADPLVLPGPEKVLAALLREARSNQLALNLGATLARVVVAYALAMSIGSAIGIVLGMSPRANRFFDFWVVLLLNIPALVVIILAYIWFGLNEVAAIGAVTVNKIPNVIVTMREGARALDTSLAEVGRVFRLGRWRSLIHIILPQMQPFFAASSRSGISLIWKIVLVVELLGRPNGVGFKIHLYFQLFDVASILAYSLAFVAVMMLVEVLILQPLERSAGKWRKRDA